MATAKLSGLILQVGDVTSVDSAGLGELTIVYNFANRQSMGIRLVGSTPSLLKMLDMTRLEELLPPSKDMQSAKQELLGKKNHMLIQGKNLIGFARIGPRWKNFSRLQSTHSDRVGAAVSRGGAE